jgi:hypothetical protein
VDGDGRLDLLTGSDNCCDHEPGFYWFRREADGRYSARPKVRVKVSGDHPLFMPRFRTALADWDGDGRLDVVAALGGTIPALYLSARDWSPDAEVVASRRVAGSPDGIGAPNIVDWDRDGRLDVVFDSFHPSDDGKETISEVVWHRNLAEAGEPRLAGPFRLTSLPAQEFAVGVSTGDWDGDGWPDLIVGSIRGGNDEKGSYRYLDAHVRVYLRRR